MSTGEFYTVGSGCIPVFMDGEQVMLTPQNTRIRQFGQDFQQYNYCEVTLDGEEPRRFLPVAELIDDMEGLGFEVDREYAVPDEATRQYVDRLMECEADRVEEEFRGML